LTISRFIPHYLPTGRCTKLKSDNAPMTGNGAERSGFRTESESRLPRWLGDLFRIEQGSTDPTLSGVMFALWRKRRTILLFAFIGALIGFLTASLIQKKYVAYMQLIPNTNNALGGSGALDSLSSLGGLSELAGGLNKPEKVTLFQQYMAIMASPEVAREMQRRGNFLSKLYPKSWDEKKHDWRPPPSGILADTKRAIKRLLNLPIPPHPTYENLAKQIAERVGIAEDKKASIYTISFANKDPVFAQKFLKALYDSTEAVLLRRDRDAARRRVKAANNELAKSTLSSNRNALTQIMVMFNLRMIEINVGPPYAAKILSDAEVSEFPTIPNVPLYTIVGFVAGIFLTSFLLAILALLHAGRVE